MPLRAGSHILETLDVLQQGIEWAFARRRPTPRKLSTRATASATTGLVRDAPGPRPLSLSMCLVHHPGSHRAVPSCGRWYTSTTGRDPHKNLGEGGLGLEVEYRDVPADPSPVPISGGLRPRAGQRPSLRSSTRIWPTIHVRGLRRARCSSEFRCSQGPRSWSSRLTRKECDLHDRGRRAHGRRSTRAPGRKPSSLGDCSQRSTSTFAGC